MDPNIITKVRLCFYEIYNENIRDLLRSNSNNLNIVEDQIKGVTISEISEFGVDDPEAAKTLIFEGVERRAMNSTKSNDVSSRSHAIIQLSVSRYDSCVEDKINVSESKFFLVDLAGNEKTFSNYTSLNKRFVEGVNINKSLLTLGKCINILSEQKKNQYVPFRDSKLTRLLKESLGGNAKTVMIACVSPDKKHYEETLNTLKYSSVAANIKNKTKRNIKQIRESELHLL
jgi:kinesin family protein 18/19